MDLWTEIEKLEGKELSTLDQRKKFAILEVLPDRIIVKTSRDKERLILWKEVENSWFHLEEHGTLT